ncbi:aspartyl protease family protein [Sphingomonas sp. CJ99]
MRLLLALFALLALAAPARADDSGWIAFDRTPGNQIAFLLTVDGRPLHALLDTGASHSVIDAQAAAALNLRLRGQGRADAIGGRASLRWTQVAAIGLGALTLGDRQLAVLALPGRATGNGRPVSMVIGADILGDHALDIDFATRRFRLLPSGRLSFAGSVLPLAPGYVTPLGLAGQTIGPALIDTGDGAALTLSRQGWDRAAFRHDGESTTIGWGVGGAVTTGIAVIERADLGDVVTRQVEARIEDAGGHIADRRLSARIGAGLLQRFRVLLDPGAGRMVLGRVEPDTSPLRSTSGLILGRAGDRLTVLHVMRGSPAEQAGFTPDDRICAVDGTQAAQADLSVLAGTPGRALSVALCNGGQRQLTLARFY